MSKALKGSKKSRLNKLKRSRPESAAADRGARSKSQNHNKLFVPASLGSIKLKTGAPVFAAGAELKSAFCMVRGGKAFVSPDFGELKTFDALKLYKQTFEQYLKYLKINPGIIACDLHPNYCSTLFAEALVSKNRDLKLVRIQHHHAHIASVIAEHRIEEPVLGFAFDGMGFGVDGNIWGGECFLAKDGKFSRLAHFKYMPQPGGDTATREVWRLGLSLLKQSGVTTVPEHIKKQRNYKEVEAMLDKNINSPVTSSAGRIFDAVSAVLGLCLNAKFEAQAAIKLQEAALDIKLKKGYNFTVDYKLVPAIVDISPMAHEIVTDLNKSTDTATISAKFHYTLALIILELAKRFWKKYKIRRVALSGGVFQNSRLLADSKELLKENGFNVYSNEKVPVNDLGIALGQAYIAATEL